MANVSTFTQWLFEFQSQFCRPLGVCLCGYGRELVAGTAAEYKVSEDQFWVPSGKVQVEVRCCQCKREWKEIMTSEEALLYVNEPRYLVNSCPSHFSFMGKYPDVID